MYCKDRVGFQKQVLLTCTSTFLGADWVFLIKGTLTFQPFGCTKTGERKRMFVSASDEGTKKIPI